MTAAGRRAALLGKGASPHTPVTSSPRSPEPCSTRSSPPPRSRTGTSGSPSTPPVTGPTHASSTPATGRTWNQDAAISSSACSTTNSSAPPSSTPPSRSSTATPAPTQLPRRPAGQLGTAQPRNQPRHHRSPDRPRHRLRPCPRRSAVHHLARDRRSARCVATHDGLRPPTAFRHAAPLEHIQPRPQDHGRAVTHFTTNNDQLGDRADWTRRVSAALDHTSGTRS